MKKFTLLLSAFFLTNLFFAQTTITNSDMPSVNDTFRLSETNNIQGGDPVLTGPNYTWNYAALTPASQRIDTFYSVTSTPIAYQLFFNNIILYPNHKSNYAVKGQNIGIPQVSITEVFNYFKNSSSAYDNAGFGSNINGIPSSTQNTPVDREYEFPMNYNNNHTVSYEYGTTVPGFGHYGQFIERIDTVDGWGSLTTPFGTFNCLRVKSILNKTDTTYISSLSFGTTIPRPQEIEYKWLSAAGGIPMLKIVTNAGVVSSIEYQDNFISLVNLDEINIINQVNLFPNPVKNYLVIDFNSSIAGNLKVNLTDISGKDVGLVYTDKVHAGENKLLIDLSQYTVKPGIYFMNMEIDGKGYYTEKIVVVE